MDSTGENLCLPLRNGLPAVTCHADVALPGKEESACEQDLWRACPKAGLPSPKKEHMIVTTVCTCTGGAWVKMGSTWKCAEMELVLS